MEIIVLVRNSVRALVTVSRVSPTTWAISSWVDLQIEADTFRRFLALTADSSRKQAIFSVAEGVRPR